jgi:hypothetical protein
MFTNETIWSWGVFFFFGRGDYWYNIFTSHRSIQIFIILKTVLVVCAYRNSTVLSRLSNDNLNLVDFSILLIFSYFYKVRCIVPSFTVIVIWVFSLFSLANLAKGLPILLLFSKNVQFHLFFCFLFYYLHSNLHYFLPSASIGDGLLLFT